MTKINRYTGNYKPFGANSQGTERTIFEAPGATDTQSDTLDANINTDYLRGWGDNVVGPSQFPTRQQFNAGMFTLGQTLSYLHQEGIPEWDSLQEFNAGSISKVGGHLFVSAIDANIGNDPITDTANWRPYSGYLFNTVADAVASSPAIGAQVVTLGYYAAGDGGGGQYLVAASQAVNGLSDHVTANTNVILLQTDGVANLKQWGAKGDGVADDTSFVQGWVDSLIISRDEGFVPTGIYRLTAQVVITDPISFIGVMPSAYISTFTGTDKPNDKGLGSWFHLDHAGVGFGIEAPNVDDGAERISNLIMQGFGTFRNHSDSTGVGWTPTVAGWDIQFRANDYSFPTDCYIRDYVMLNPYQGINATRPNPATAGSIGRLVFENVIGQPMNRGIEIDYGLGRCTFNYVQFWPFWDAGDTVTEYTKNNCVAVRLGRADRFTIDKCFFWGVREGIETFTTANPGGGVTSVFITDIGFDANGLIGLNVNSDGNEVHVNNATYWGDVALGPLNRAIYVQGSNNTVFVRGGRLRNCNAENVRVIGTGNKTVLSNTWLVDWDYANTSNNSIFSAAGNTTVINGGLEFNLINSPGNASMLYGGDITSYRQGETSYEVSGRFVGTPDASGFLTIPHGLTSIPAWATATIDSAGSGVQRAYNAVVDSRDATNVVLFIKDDTGAAVTSGTIRVGWQAALF